MKKVKKNVVVSLLMFFIIAGVVTFSFAETISTLHEVQKKGRLRFGWATWWPYNYRDSKTNQITGISVDIAEEMAKALNVKLEWVEDSYATFAGGIQANKFDIWNMVNISVPRALAVGFTDPLLVQGFSIIAKKSAEPGLKDWTEIDKEGKKVCVTLGASTDLLVTKVFEKAEIIRIRTSPEAFNAMMMGKADVYASTIDSLMTLAQKNPDTYVVPGEFGRAEAAFAVRQGDYVWISWLNVFIKQMKMERTILRLLKKYGLDSSFAAP